MLRKISRQMPDPIKKVLVRNGRLLYPRHSKGFILLAYHLISSKEGYPYSVSSKAFESHLVHIKKFYNVVPVGDIITRIKSGGIFEDVLIALTFDDGFKNNYDIALPLLAKHNIPATIFISTDIVQKNYKSFLSWDNIKEMSKNNLISFGSHGCTHAALTSLKKNDIEYELIFSKDEIESKIGVPVHINLQICPTAFNFWNFPKGHIDTAKWSQNVLLSITLDIDPRRQNRKRYF